MTSELSTPLVQLFLLEGVLSAIDTPLPTAPDHRHTMTMHKPDWVEIPEGELQFPQYPDSGIEDWHRERGLYGKL